MNDTDFNSNIKYTQFTPNARRCVQRFLGNLSFCLANRMVVSVTIFDANQMEREEEEEKNV